MNVDVYFKGFLKLNFESGWSYELQVNDLCWSTTCIGDEFICKVVAWSC